ncbi:MAG: fatty acid CoA ligase family protein [Thermodesulfobacteriota bacterium]|nr:fatty acid CoA ligase family protein [Thermodesulfobacteriota bacterium]
MASNPKSGDRSRQVNDTVNVASYLTEMARRRPYQKAIINPVSRDDCGRVTYAHLTFRQLEKETDCLSHGLESIGISRGIRTILMVPPGPDFFTLIFALFKVGAVPVVVDPGMGIKRMIQCLRHTEPTAFIGVSKAYVLRILYSRHFRSVNTWVTVGPRKLFGAHSLARLFVQPWKPYQTVSTGRDETAAILFTTGSTGPAKGAVYTHGNFDAQVRLIRSHFKIKPGEIDLPTFPLFALFDPALGMTAVIPDMDPTHPARANPVKIVEAIVDHGVTNIFASPALLDRVGEFGQSRGIRLPSLKRVISAGAPVSPAIIETFSSLLTSKSQIHTPYGATEAMPVTSIASEEILTKTRKMSEKGSGICVGRPIDSLSVRIIQVSDMPINKWHYNLLVPSGQIGEIVVKGDLVTKRYYDNPAADALSKIRDSNGFWHRMGDLGWMDVQGRIWFCGRKNHRVVMHSKTLYTIPCEAVFNNHPDVFRSALVGVGTMPEQKPVICIELKKSVNESENDRIREELISLAGANPHTKDITTAFFHQAFPVDIRHNAKIFREDLADWAAEQLQEE